MRFSVLSSLCGIINDQVSYVVPLSSCSRALGLLFQETVAMSAIYIHAGAVAGGVNELKSLLLQIMHPMKRPGYRMLISEPCSSLRCFFLDECLQAA